MNSGWETDVLSRSVLCRKALIENLPKFNKVGSHFMKRELNGQHHLSPVVTGTCLHPVGWLRPVHVQVVRVYHL